MTCKGCNTELTAENKSSWGKLWCKECVAKKTKEKRDAKQNEEVKVIEAVPIDESVPRETITKKKAPIRRNTKEKEETRKSIETQIKLLLMGTSIFAAGKVNEVWEMSEVEADNIASPLSKILIETAFFSQIANSSNYLTLITALGLYSVPRIIMIKGGVKNEKPIDIVCNDDKEPNTTRKVNPDNAENVLSKL